MSFQLYNSQMAQDKKWQAKYLEAPLDTGITSPQGYTVAVPEDPMFRAVDNQVFRSGNMLLVRDTINPSGMLQSFGRDASRFLLSSSMPECDSGCLPTQKPNPTVQSIKPLYQASMPAPGANVVGPYSALGMY